MVSVADLGKRDNGYYCETGWFGSGGRCYRHRSRWYRWGRWLCMALIIAAALFVAFCFLLPVLRRRKNKQNTTYPQQPQQEYQQQYPQQQYQPQQEYQQEYNNGYNQEFAPPSHPPPAKQDYAPPPGPPPVHYENHP